MASSARRIVLLVLLLGSTGSFLAAEGSVEPMSAVRVTGLPPYVVEEQVVQSAWAREDLLRLTTFAPSGESAQVEIAGIGNREFPPEPIAAIRSNAVERASGIRRTIELYDSENRLLGEVALNQTGGAQILDTFAVTAGLRHSATAGRRHQTVDIALTRLTGSPSRIPIKVAPGHSIVFNVDGVRWIFTCRGATVDNGLSFDYTLFRE